MLSHVWKQHCDANCSCQTTLNYKIVFGDQAIEPCSRWHRLLIKIFILFGIFWNWGVTCEFTALIAFNYSHMWRIELLDTSWYCSCFIQSYKTHDPPCASIKSGHLCSCDWMQLTQSFFWVSGISVTLHLSKISSKLNQ